MMNKFYGDMALFYDFSFYPCDLDHMAKHK